MSINNNDGPGTQHQWRMQWFDESSPAHGARRHDSGLDSGPELSSLSSDTDLAHDLRDAEAAHAAALDDGAASPASRGSQLRRAAAGFAATGARTARRRRRRGSESIVPGDDADELPLVGPLGQDSSEAASPTTAVPIAGDDVAAAASTDGSEGDEGDMSANVENDSLPKPLDPAPLPAEEAALTLRWSRRHVCVAVVLDHATAVTRGSCSITHVSAVFEAAQLHVAFAPSPEACRLLFRVLTGADGVIEGSAQANGLPLTMPAVGRVIGAVPCFDASLSDATVADNIALAARLRLAAAYGVAQLVDDALAILGLGSFRHDVVGAASPLVRLLTNVGMEIVASPALLVLRDPFRTLSGYEQVEAAEVLSRIAATLCIPVIAVATDVPYSLDERADGTLLALNDQGTVVYSGPKSQAARFFNDVARLCGARSVTAAGEDAVHAADLSPFAKAQTPSAASAAAASGSSRGATPTTFAEVVPLPLTVGDIIAGCRRTSTTAAVAAAFDRHQASIDLRASVMRASDSGARRGDFTDAPAAAAAAWAPPVADARGRCGCGVLCGPRCASRAALRAWLAQTTVRAGALVRYGVLQPFRRPEQGAAWAALLVMFVLCALLASRQGGDAFGMMNKRGIIFFLLSLAMHVNALFVPDDVAHRNAMAHLRRRRLCSPFATWAATIARLALPRVAMAVAAYVAASAWFRQAHWLSVLVGLTSCAHALALALLLLFVPDTRAAGIALGVYYGVAVFFSGFVLTPATAPPALSRISLLRPAYGGAVAHETAGREWACDAWQGNSTQSYCFRGDEYLRMMGLQDDSAEVGALTLTFVAAGLALLLLIGVHVRS